MCFVIASLLCHTLAGRTKLTICTSKPWWLGDAAGLIIRAQGAEIVNKSQIIGGSRFLLHLTALGLGRALDYIITMFYDDV
jgi:hypothetical protein